MTDTTDETVEATETTETSAAERPEWLPEKFWGEGGPNVENLAKSYAELERQRGASLDELKSQWEQERLAVRPESADKYELPKIEALDAEELATSPIVSAWRAIAHEAGLDQTGFEKGIAGYVEAEVARLEAQAAAELAALGDNAKVRTGAVSAWAQQTFTDPAEFQAVQQIATTAAGVKVLEKVMRMTASGGDDASAFEAQAANEETLADIRKLMDSRAYWDPKQRDPAIVRRVEAFFEKQARR